MFQPPSSSLTAPTLLSATAHFQRSPPLRPLSIVLVASARAQQLFQIPPPFLPFLPFHSVLLPETLRHPKQDILPLLYPEFHRVTTSHAPATLVSASRHSRPPPTSRRLKHPTIIIQYSPHISSPSLVPLPSWSRYVLLPETLHHPKQDILPLLYPEFHHVTTSRAPATLVSASRHSRPPPASRRLKHPTIVIQYSPHISSPSLVPLPSWSR
ncbi:hypothetical protein C8R43DRAFT_1192255 [Mycena crocata]|nr:hypothetical protein C8R43DRAFT_1192255 [Mycena crocata]